MDDLGILDTWVAGHRHPAARRLVMLAAAYPELPGQRLAELPVGQANLLLLRDRQATIGTTVEGEAVCPDCQQRLEVSVELTELLGGGPASPDRPTGGPDEATLSRNSAGEATDRAGVAPDRAGVAPDRAGEGEVRAGGLVLRFRLASAGDLADAAGCTDPAEASRLLLRRCVLAARRGDEPIPPDQLPAELVAALDAELARRDPLADLRLSIACPGCRRSFELALDPAALYWSELAERARRLLSDVHRLASAYGWTEPEILGIHPVRRAAYLELVG
jgi:hypothetical protein